VDYDLLLTARAEEDLADLPREVLIRADGVIIALAQSPRPHGSKKLRDAGEVWSVRVGREYRILYSIDDTARQVTIARVRHRRDAYR